MRSITRLTGPKNPYARAFATLLFQSFLERLSSLAEAFLLLHPQMPAGWRSPCLL
ncbi:MAG: hypothetical protein HQ548_03135 [Chloroflexi bacterium]|nr:hypothetical protein [Chloroflexota bacterium]